LRDALTEELLAKIMKWTPEDVARERPDLQALATYKYDEYQQFSPGMRFLESLARWLDQFDTDEERHVAYNFLRKKVIYISTSEMSNLVLTSYPDVIRPFLIKQIAVQKKMPEWQVTRIAESKEFKVLLRQSMFLGLSDGSRIDIFRRGNPAISHEQILRTHEINETRAADMLQTLDRDLKEILRDDSPASEKRFHDVFLLDDFSGSGISYLRKAEKPSFKGKLANFYYDNCCENSKNINRLIDPADVHICLILYIATNQAYDHLRKLGSELFGKVPFDVRVVNLLTDSIRLNDQSDAAFISLLSKYYDKRIETESYLRGKHEKPYLGFDECALPLILNHNTPNNSVTLLWFEENRKYRGLFPRISRFTT
jgi:hypothetical protein